MVLGHRALSVLPFLPNSRGREELMRCHTPYRHQPERLLSSDPGGRPVSTLGLRDEGSQSASLSAQRWPQAPHLALV